MFGLPIFRITKQLLILGLLVILSGCATTQGPDQEANVDPIEDTNRVFFDFTETLDKHFLKPVAEGYVAITPDPVRTGVTNFFDNLTYLNVILNGFLQGKFEQGFEDTLRFVANSTLGIGGLFDVATDMGLERHQEDFGQTLAVWGVDQGAYLFIPLMGPNTVRDTTDFVPSTLLNPFFYVTSTLLFPVSALNAINTRANLLEASNIRDEAAIDPYAFTREAHLQQREFLIYDGNPPVADDFDDFILEEEEESTGVLVIE